MKIIGNTVGTTLPKPDFKQTDPTKGDYIKNKPEVVDATVGELLAIKTIDEDGHIVEFKSVAVSTDDTLDSAKAYTDAEITEWVGDKTVPVQVNAVLTTAKSYTDTEIANLLNNSTEAIDSIYELRDAMEDNADAIFALETIAGNKANASDLTSHTSNKNNPHGVTLSQLGVTATAAELNIMDGVTATTAELNYVDGVTSNIQTQLNAKVPTSRTVNGKALSGDITLSATDVGADTSGSASAALTSAKSYTDSEIAEWIGDKDVATQINTAVSTKANTSDLTSHTGNTTAHITSTERTSWNAAKTHADSAHAPSNAEANQNAFSNIAVGSTTIAAESKTDTLTLAGSNVTITPDANNDKVTIGITKDNVTAALGYTPPTTNSTYDAAGSSLGLVKSGGDVTISSGVITVNDDSHSHVISNVDGLQTALDAKAKASDLSDLKALVGDTAVATQISTAIASKSDTGHTHDDRYYTESEINTKLSGKSDTDHTHSAYVNQNAFSNVKVGTNTIAADSTTDTLTLTAGSNITLTADTSGDGVTIAATDTVYTHPSSGVTAGTYKSVTVNAQGHVTGGSNPTTLAGYGITDAAAKNHTHDYADSSHTHDYAASSHSHDDRYYTETEVNTKFSNMVGDTAVATQISDAIDEITPSSIGAAAASHGNHVPATQTASNKVFLRNDNTWQTVTPANIGAATSGHTHDSYASTVTTTGSGNAVTAISQSGNTITATKGATFSTTDHTHSYIPTSEKGVASGVATLDTSGKVPAAQLPSYVDDVVEGYYLSSKFYKTNSTSGTVITGETGKIYVDLSTNKTYRWSGSAYVVISETLALGETSSTAYAGDKGKANATAIAALQTKVGDSTVASQISTAIADKADKDHTHTKSEITDFPTSMPASDVSAWAKASTKPTYTYSEVGAAKSDHTHNYAGSSSAGGAATSANKVNKSLTVKLNSGTTEGTNMFTFDGSAAKSVNITPSGIGAAASSHGTHVSYSSTAPVMDGTASVGSASTVARSDHKHPTDTSRAAASDITALQGLVGDTAVATQISDAVEGHTHTVSHTPAGSVSSSFSGTAASHDHGFTGSAVTSGAPSETTSVNSMTSAGSLPSHSYTAPSCSYTAPSLTASCANQCLTLTFSAGSHSFNAGSHSFSAGSLPTSSAVTVAASDHTHSVTAAGTVGSKSITPAGSVTSTFTGTKADITTSGGQ